MIVRGGWKSIPSYEAGFTRRGAGACADIGEVEKHRTAEDDGTPLRVPPLPCCRSKDKHDVGSLELDMANGDQGKDNTGILGDSKDRCTASSITILRVILPNRARLRQIT